SGRPLASGSTVAPSLAAMQRQLIGSATAGPSACGRDVRDGAAGMVEQLVLDSADRTVGTGPVVPADHDEVGAGAVAGQHMGRMVVHHVLPDCHPWGFF